MIRAMLMVALASATLTTAAAAAETAPTATTESPLDDTKLVCRKTLETGSLVRKKKQCFTALQWDRIAQQTRIGNQKVADQLATGCGTNGGVC